MTTPLSSNGIPMELFVVHPNFKSHTGTETAMGQGEVIWISKKEIFYKIIKTEA